MNVAGPVCERSGWSILTKCCGVSAGVHLQEQKEAAYVDMEKANEEKDKGNTGGVTTAAIVE